MKMMNNDSSVELPIQEPLETKPDKKHNHDLEGHEVQKRSCNIIKNIGVYFKEYCVNSNIHGVRFLGETGRPITEKLWWLIICIISIIYCSNLILKTWDKQNKIFTISEDSTPIWHIPFPAITICSENKVRQSVYNFTLAFHNYKNASLMGDVKKYLSPDELKYYERVSLICDTHMYETREKKVSLQFEEVMWLCKWNKTKGFMKLKKHVLSICDTNLNLPGKNTEDESALNFIHEVCGKQVAPSFDEMIWICKWKNYLNTTCEELFHPVLTEEGLCYTFNQLDTTELFNTEAQNLNYLNHGRLSNWTIENGYTSTASGGFPRRAETTGYKGGLTIVLKSYDYDFDYICRGAVQGFKIFVHNPAEIPRTGQQFIRAPVSKELIVAIQPEMMTISHNLKRYDVSQRHCYFSYERKLRFYKVYTQYNCEVECLANFTLKMCECVAFYMPRSSSTPICGAEIYDCVEIAPRKLLLHEIDPNLSEKYKCNCLPACTSLSYSTETSKSDFNADKIFQAFKANLSEFPGIQLARVTIAFKNLKFTQFMRSEMFDRTEFLAKCGGLLCLFMGFSFLSLVEIIYFLTLRIWCNVRNASRMNRSRDE